MASLLDRSPRKLSKRLFLSPKFRRRAHDAPPLVVPDLPSTAASFLAARILLADDKADEKADEGGQHAPPCPVPSRPYPPYTPRAPSCPVLPLSLSPLPPPRPCPAPTPCP